MPRRCQLGEDQAAIRRHLESTSVGGYEADGLNHMLELIKQFPCQAHGPVSVVSDRAIYDLDPQHIFSPAEVVRYVVGCTNARSQESALQTCIMRM